MENEKIKTFKDLEFIKHPGGLGYTAEMLFIDGSIMTVKKGHKSYKCDNKTFEVTSSRFWRKTGGVKGFMTKRQISFHMKMIQRNLNFKGSYAKEFTKSQELAIELVNEACDVFGLNAKSRKRIIVDQRRAIYNFLVRKHNLSLTDAGNILGRDHSTVLYNLKEYDNLQNDLLFRQNTDLIETFLNTHEKSAKNYQLNIEINFDSLNYENALKLAENIAKMNNGQIIELKEIENEIL